MQYILSEDEYRELVDAPKKVRAELTETIQDLCTRVCEHEPVPYHWGPGKPPKDVRIQPWGCLLNINGHTCDLCPVQGVCPHHPKEWSQ